MEMNPMNFNNQNNINNMGNIQMGNMLDDNFFKIKNLVKPCEDKIKN